MFPLRRLVGFFVRFLIFYGLLLIPWPGLGAAYAACYRAGGNLLFGSFGAQGRAHFQPLPQEDPFFDTQVVMTNRAKRTQGTLENASRYQGYEPTVCLVALVLATPITWSRKWRALLWGLLLVQGFVAVRIALPLLREFSRDNALALFSPSPFWSGVLDQANEVLVYAAPSVFVVPILIWILVAVRREDVQRWTDSPPDDSRRQQREHGEAVARHR